jgi:hypothetical protein
MDPPFVRGSDTSEAAADSVGPFTASLRRQALLTIESGGPDGRTCDECEVILGGRHQTVSARIWELVQLNLIFDTGKRRPTRSRRKARIYKLTPWAEALLVRERQKTNGG